jgi:ATP-binding cassette subfamily B (MDR/TAP) protein 1
VDLQLGKVMAAATNKTQATYAEAGSIAQEALSSIRTVVAFGGEARVEVEYKKRLILGYNINVKKGFYASLGIGILMLVLFCTYALAFYVGSIFVENNIMNGGQVVNVFFAVIIGAFSTLHYAF